MGRSSTWEQTTATFPSIPPRCSRLHTQPPSNPTSMGCSAFCADGASLAGEAHARSASSCCCTARCLPPRLVSRRISSALICAPLSRSIGPRASGQHGRLLQGSTDGSSLELGEQAGGWTGPAPTPQTAKAPARYFDAPEARCDHPACRSFQAALRVPTVRTGPLLILPLPDGLFQGRAHGLLARFLNLLFHFCDACGCFDLDDERYLYSHE